MLPYGKQTITQDDIDAVVETLKSNYLTGGPTVTEFENIVKDYVGAKHAIALSNATAALHVACLSLDLKESDRGVTVPNTFLATANCIAYCGAIPEFIDINLDSLCMCPERLEEYIKTKGPPKVVIPVDFAGVPADLPKIWDLAKKYNFYVIEDAAHSIGSYYYHNDIKIRCGSCVHSDFAVFSFHPVKTVTAGEGGMLLTNNDELARKARMFSCHGIERDQNLFEKWNINNENGEISDKSSKLKNIDKAPWLYQQQVLGYNYRITDIQSALGISQFKRIDETIDKRQKIFNIYQEKFRDYKNLLTPVEFPNMVCAYHLYVIRYNGDDPQWRVKKVNKLRDNGIFAQIHYIPIHLQPWYVKNFGKNLDLYSNSENYYSNCISIPLFPDIAEEDIQRVIKLVVE